MELSYRQINRDLLRTMEPAGRLYYAVLGVDLVILLWGIFAWVYQIKTGIGVTNLNNPVGWGVYIATFVFWIGIAHSGTLISAILFLFRCHWRNPIYRTAEAMTVFALLTGDGSAVRRRQRFDGLGPTRPDVEHLLAREPALAAGMGCIRRGHIPHRELCFLLYRPCS